MYNVTVYQQGRPQDLAGGARNKFVQIWKFAYMSRSDMLRVAKPCTLLGGFGGMLPQRKLGVIIDVY